MTIWEFAKKAGVSVATISRALNPETRCKVLPATLARLESLAKKYNYTPNLAAKHLRGASFKTVGVLLPHLGGIFFSDYYAKILSGVADALLQTRYCFKVVLLKPERTQWDKYDFKRGESIDGLLVTHWPNFFSKASVLDKLNVPCAVINDPEKNVRAYFVGGDNRMGGFLAAEHLYLNGHRKIAILAGPSWSSDSRLRVRGFRNFFEKIDEKNYLEILSGDFQEKKAIELTKNFLKEKREVTAFFCCNDLMACGVIKALKEMSIRCPEDISVVGYDDDSRARTSEPLLTTIRVPLYDLTKKMTGLLVDHLKGKGKKKNFSGEILFPVKLVERASVARLATH